jgi:glutathione synthase/RimK-type ligase-like ATP-grasp enzyme
LTRIAILVPDPDYPEKWGWAFDRQAAVLRSHGADVHTRPWTDPGDLSGFDVVTPLVAWGYNRQPERWLATLDALEAAAIPLCNPAALLRWNSDKRYLEELGAKGIVTVPTRMVDALDQASLAEARADFGDDLVVKPPVSAGADGTYRLAPADRIPADVAGRAMMVQPFLPSVMDEGEYSLMLFGGNFSHAIVKRPKAGDYRVQPHLGGRDEKCEPPSGAIELARLALDEAPAPPTYARVDLVRGLDGQLAVIELELIEPALWLDHAPDGGASFAAAMLAQ